MNKLIEHIEEISDDFKSTFVVRRPNILDNMLRGPHEFDEVTQIIKKYCGDDVTVSFKKLNIFPNEYDCYRITVEGLV